MQVAIAGLFRVINRYLGNLPPMPGVFPDYPAPVVRNDQGELEMVMMRWRMPPPPKFGGPPVTNIRNTHLNLATKKKDIVWFVLNDDRPLFAFAGIWTEFNGDRGAKSKPVQPRTLSTAS